MEQWQYRSVQVDGVKAPDDALLDQMGADGWELVAAIPIIGRTELGDIAITLAIRYVFKRRVS